MQMSFEKADPIYWMQRIQYKVFYKKVDLENLFKETLKQFDPLRKL